MVILFDQIYLLLVAGAWVVLVSFSRAAYRGGRTITDASLLGSPLIKGAPVETDDSVDVCASTGDSVELVSPEKEPILAAIDGGELIEASVDEVADSLVISLDGPPEDETTPDGVSEMLKVSFDWPVLSFRRFPASGPCPAVCCWSEVDENRLRATRFTWFPSEMTWMTGGSVWAA